MARWQTIKRRNVILQFGIEKFVKKGPPATFGGTVIDDLVTPPENPTCNTHRECLPKTGGVICGYYRPPCTNSFSQEVYRAGRLSICPFTRIYCQHGQLEPSVKGENYASRKLWRRLWAQLYEVQ